MSREEKIAQAEALEEMADNMHHRRSVVLSGSMQQVDPTYQNGYLAGLDRAIHTARARAAQLRKEAGE